MKRPLPASKVLAPFADEPMPPMKGKFSTRNAAPKGCADEMNAQRTRPVYDEFKKRGEYENDREGVE